MRDLKEKEKGDEGQTGSNETLVRLRNSPQPAVARPELDAIPTLSTQNLSNSSLWEQGKQAPPISQVPLASNILHGIPRAVSEQLTLGCAQSKTCSHEFPEPGDLNKPSKLFTGSQIVLTWGHIPPVSSYLLHNSNDSRTSMAHFQLIPFLNSPLARCPCDCVGAVSEVQSEQSTVYTMPAEEKQQNARAHHYLHYTFFPLQTPVSTLRPFPLCLPVSSSFSLSRAFSRSCAPFRGLLSPATSASSLRFLRQ